MGIILFLYDIKLHNVILVHIYISTLVFLASSKAFEAFDKTYLFLQGSVWFRGRLTPSQLDQLDSIFLYYSLFIIVGGHPNIWYIATFRC